MTKKLSARSTKAEFEHLRSRLVEAEETLRAIRSGDVDAIAVDGPHGRQIFTLQSADQPYRVLAERMSEGAASMTADGTILFCNQRLSEMVGRAPEALVGVSATMLAPPGSEGDFQEFLASGLKGEIRREMQFQRSDSTVIPVLASLTTIPGEQGPGLCLIAMDFSEHRQTEARIRLQASQYAALLATTSDGYWRFDRLGKLLDVNDVYCQMSGYSRIELLQLSIADIVVGEEPAEVLQHTERVASTGFDRFGSKHRKKNGEIFDVEISASYFKATDEFILFVRDTTARKLAEDKVRQTAALLDLAHDAVIVGGLDNRILFWSRGASDTYGFSADEALGRIAHELLHTCFPASLEAITTSIQQSREWEGELRHTRKDGRAIVVSSRWSLLRDEQGQPVAIMEINRDVTDQKQANEAVRKASHYTRSLIEASLDPLVTISREGKITDVNEATEKVTGVSRQQLIETDFCDYFTEPKKARAGYEKVFAQGAVHDYPLAIRSASGTVTDVLYNASVFCNDAGEVEGVFAAARDVTEHKRAEQKLREQAALLDLAHDAILLRGMDGRILFWSRGAVDLYGWSAEEILDKVAHTLLRTEFPISLEALQTSIQTTREWEGELKHICRDGSAIVVASRWSLLRDEQGEPVAIMEINRDITDRKQAEEALRKASHYTRSLIEASLDPLVTISREGKITDVNEATEKVTGVPRQRLIGTDFSDYFTEPEKAREGYQKVFAQGAVHDYPLAIRSASGVVTDVLYNASVFSNDAGEVEGVFAAARDVTERKRAELALKKASLYTRSLIEASLDPLVTISREGKITDVNEATENITGVSRQRLIGTDFSNYFTQLEMARAGYRQVFADGSVTDYPLVLRHISGKVTDVLYNASVFKNESGEVEGVFAAARDVTRRKRAEEEVRKLNEELEQRVAARTEELRVVNKELEAFNYAVAHDLRAPLRHIHGFTEMLVDEARPVLTDSCKHQLDTILDSVQHMSQLLEDLLKLSRLGRQELCKQVCSANGLMAEVINGLEPESKGREVEWRITNLPQVECDPALFKQVLVNLLSNALKFTRTRHPAIIEIGETIIDGEAAIYIRDNGVGFSMKYADKLFGLFQRLHRQQDFEGTGVGLAIVQRIMHRHGGRVWAEAELDKGATFYLSLHSCEAARKELAAVHGAV